MKEMSGSAKAVSPREPFGEQAHEQCDGQTDDVRVVALDPRYERRAETLDGVGAGASLPLAAADVDPEVARRQWTKRDARDLAVQFLPRTRTQAEPRNDLVGSAGQKLEHSLSIPG